MLSRKTERVRCIDTSQINRRELALKLNAVYDVVDIDVRCDKVRVSPIGGKPLIGWYESTRFTEVPKTQEV
jgi:hypothetical protein